MYSIAFLYNYDSIATHLCGVHINVWFRPLVVDMLRLWVDWKRIDDNKNVDLEKRERQRWQDQNGLGDPMSIPWTMDSLIAYRSRLEWWEKKRLDQTFQADFNKLLFTSIALKLTSMGNWSSCSSFCIFTANRYGKFKWGSEKTDPILSNCVKCGLDTVHGTGGDLPI